MFVQGAVQGHFGMLNGAVHLLAPAPQGLQVHVRPPTAQDIMNKIATGQLLVHPSKAALTKEQISAQLCNIQRALCFGTGAAGRWSPEADVRLSEWLVAAKRQRRDAGPPMLALGALPPPPPAPPAPPAPPLLALPAEQEEEEPGQEEPGQEEEDEAPDSTSDDSDAPSSDSSFEMPSDDEGDEDEAEDDAEEVNEQSAEA